ncbi:hypothetical protein [Cytobacillus kochii]|uniref:hypothetical protein n=1 Tax=Cytobacillus kochii TaxID=859143 RepID=UPI001CD50339|nr:hypothetical protein [Cytobacillus kochii]MCA1026317.1 hypothetical protein [Cytobacillus kochii]MCM3344985.1 hypothetical protein [Cytobacillus kochii]MDQ0187343.1 hypothetical protein [Cytobacillus kochii]
MTQEQKVMETLIESLIKMLGNANYRMSEMESRLAQLECILKESYDRGRKRA